VSTFFLTLKWTMLLQTERLVLREFTEVDWPAVLAYHSTPGYQRFYPEIGCTEAGARAFVSRFLQWQQEEPRSKYQWAVVLRRQARLIGTCGLRKSAPHSPEGEIGCELAPQHWGRGYTAELSGPLLRFGFEELGLHRIYAHCIAENTAAVYWAEKLGMRQEGRLRENVYVRGQWHDTLVYSILRQEWCNPESAST
jgi:ribosomal-protein-alanine N-acetyltransferase